MSDLTISDIGAVTPGGTLLSASDFRTATAIWPDLTIPGDSDSAVTDANVSSAIAAATRAVELYCRDDFTGDSASTSTLILDGTGTRSLLLPKRVQASSVTAVEERDGDGTYTTITSTDYRVRSSLASDGTASFVDGVDIIEYIASSSKWTEGVLNVRVTGKFGWAVAPWEVKRAVALIVYDWLSGKNAGMHRADSWQTPNMSFERAQATFMGIPEVRDLLEQYRRFTIAVA